MTSMTKICAVIISYNPDKLIEKCAFSVVSQVDKLLIIDNGSKKEKIEILKRPKKKFEKIKLILNKENLGIATALNQGARYAIKNKYNWLLTLDQDSILEKDMIKKMLNTYGQLSQKDKEKIGILAPNYKTAKGLTYKEKPAIQVVPVAITSGQLVKISLFKKIGNYKDDLFIECVDNEFCLRAKKEGYETIIISRAVLSQKIGDNPKTKKLFGKRFIVSGHSPIRFYYIFRNSIYLYKKFFFNSPKWVFGNIFSNTKLVFKIIFFEDKTLKKISMALKGVVHGLANHYGKY